MGTRIVLADADASVREGFAALLAAESDFAIASQAGDGLQAVERIRELRPDVAILELNMPKLHGVEVIRRTLKLEAGVRLGVLSSSRNQKIAHEALRLGACAYVLKEGPSRHLVEAIRVMVGGGIYISPSLLAEALLAQPEPPLVIPPPWMIPRK